MNIKVKFTENNHSFKATMEETSVIDPSDKLAKVAKTGDYNDLINTPSKVSEFENDSGFITEDDIPEVPTKLSELTNDLEKIKFGNVEYGADEIRNTIMSEYAIRSFTLGLYSQTFKLDSQSTTIKNVVNPTENGDAVNKKYVDDAISKVDVPEKLSELENDCGFITADNIPNVEVPTKMSELEQDLNKLNIGMVRISQDKNGVATMGYIGSGYLNIEGYGLNINPAYGVDISSSGSGDVKIHKLVTPKSDTDAANKKYVDDITGDISTALTNILAIQSQYMGVSE